MITQAQYNTSNQKKKNIDVIVKLQNSYYQTLDELHGVVLDGGLNVSDGDVRRSCNLSIFAKDDSFSIKEDGKIWIDKYVKILINVKDNKTNEDVSTNIGTYVVTNPSQSYDQVSNTINLELLDPMCKLNGYMGGNLKGNSYVIKAGENVRSAIIAILELNNIHKYTVVDIAEAVPNDIVIDSTGNYFEILKQLRDIMPRHQMYFDTEGTFIFDEIPINSNETVVANSDILNNKIISWSTNTDFSNIKNMITVIGKTHDVENFDNEPTFTDNTFSLNLPQITSLYNYTKIGFVASQSTTNPKIKVNDFESKECKIYNGNDVEILANTYYVISYRDDDDYFEFYGEVEPRYTIRDTSSESSFSVQKLGEIDITLSGGEYDDIYSTELAKQRSEWELYQYTRLQVVLNLNIVPIYWLNNINEVVELKLPNEQNETIIEQYIINSLNFTFDVNGTQSLNLSKYYPFYASDDEIIPTGRYIEGTVNNINTRVDFDTTEEMIDFIFRNRENFSKTLKIVKTDIDTTLNLNFLLYGAKQLEVIDMRYFNVDNNTSMANMFLDNVKLHTVFLPDMSRQALEVVGGMFWGCLELSSVDLSTMNTENVKDFNGMFLNCQKLRNVNFDNLSTISATTMVYFLWNCPSLREVDLSSFDMNENIDTRDMFAYSSSIRTAYAKTQKDADILNASLNKPTTFNFVVK